MPITNISIENFKGIGKRVDIPIRPITLLFGANSAGKSTILQALLYLRHVLENREPIKVNADKLEVSGESIDLGGFSQFVHNQDTSKEVVIGVTVTVDDDGLKGFSQKPDEELELFKEIKEVTIRVGISQGTEILGSKIFVSRYEIDFDGHNIASIKSNKSLSQVNLSIREDHPVFKGEVPDYIEDQFHEIDSEYPSVIHPILWIYRDLKKKDAESLDLPPKTLCIPRRGETFLDTTWPGVFNDKSVNFNLASYQLNQILLGVYEEAINQLRDLRHLFGIRELPDRVFRSKISLDQSRWANGLAAWDILYDKTKQDSEKTIKALNDLGLTCRFEIEEFYKIPILSGGIGSIPDRHIKSLDNIDTTDEEFLQACKDDLDKALTIRELIISDGQTKLHIKDIGLGVSQVLPIVVGAYDKGFRIMSVEQPELHIHPATQCKLADVLAHAVLGNDKTGDKQLILETHSEHLMLRLLRRIREKHEQELPPGAPEVDPDDLSVLYVEKDDEGVKISHLPVTEDGDFEKKWPKGFFEERTEELF